MKSSLILITSHYPFSKGEEFIESELQMISQKFDNVTIFPYSATVGYSRYIPTNCKVKLSHTKVNIKGRLRRELLKNKKVVFWALSQLFLQSKHRWYYITHYKKVLTDLVLILQEGELLLKNFESELKQSNVLYFYWFDKPLIQFALLKKRGLISHKIISRGLGYDYDPVQNPLGFFPYRELELPFLDKLVVNSENGRRIVSKLYPAYINKFERSYLGLKSSGKLNPLNLSGIFHLVSCSYVIELKRVHLIADILKHLDFKIKWTHIGEGPELDSLRQSSKSLPENIECEFLGYIPSVLDYYSNISCDLFITTSFTEGLPFTLMEAISFGIPVCGTHVSGIPEIVNSYTGFTFPQMFDTVEVARQIKEFYHQPEAQKLKLRQSARNFFLKNFSAEKNVKEFISRYLKT